MLLRIKGISPWYIALLLFTVVCMYIGAQPGDWGPIGQVKLRSGRSTTSPLFTGSVRVSEVGHPPIIK